MSFKSRYGQDKNAVENGAWVDLDEGTSIKVASLKSDAAKEKRRALEKPYANFKKIPDKVSEDILIKVVSQVCLKDWKGEAFTNEDGTAIPFSVEKADELLRAYPDFLEDVVTAALSRELFRDEVNEAAKNA